MTEKKERPLFSHLLEASSVGFQLVFSTFVGLAIGYGLDSLLHTSPWLLTVFTILGIVAGFVDLVRVAKKQASDEEEEESDKDNGPDKKDL